MLNRRMRRAIRANRLARFLWLAQDATDRWATRQAIMHFTAVFRRSCTTDQDGEPLSDPDSDFSSTPRNIQPRPMFPCPPTIRRESTLQRPKPPNWS